MYGLPAKSNPVKEIEIVPDCIVCEGDHPLPSRNFEVAKRKRGVFALIEANERLGEM